MTIQDLILKALKQELTWAKEGPNPPPGQLHLSYAPFEDWTDLGELVWENMAAAILDGELLFGADLERLAEPGFLIRRNPRFVIFRSLHHESGLRESIACIRADVIPSEGEIKSLGYMAAELRDADVDERARRTGVMSSLSPRAAHREG